MATGELAGQLPLSEAMVREFEQKLPNLVVGPRRVLVAIYDRKANEILGSPVCVRTAAEAVRMFTDLVNGDEKGVLQLHPEDFRLCQIAYVDWFSCAVEPLYRQLVEGLDVVQGKESNGA